MPVHVEPSENREPVRVTYSGVMDAGSIEESLPEIADKAGRRDMVLVDFTACELDVTHSQFMGLIDRWFVRISPAIRTAIVFRAERQKDHAMLFETKAFLVGGLAKAFFDATAARTWLDAGSGQA